MAGLGRCALAAGRAAEAEDRLRQAVQIFRRIGAAGAAGISRELGALIKDRASRTQIATFQCRVRRP